MNVLSDGLEALLRVPGAWVLVLLAVAGLVRGWYRLVEGNVGPRWTIRVRRAGPLTRARRRAIRRRQLRGLHD